MTFEEWLDAPMKLETKMDDGKMSFYVDNPNKVAILKLAVVYSTLFSEMIRGGEMTGQGCLELLSEIANQVCGGCDDINKVKVYTDLSRYFGQN